VLSATHRLKKPPCPSAEVCASTFGPPGASLSSITFHALPGPWPVLAADHPSGNPPILAFSKLRCLGSGLPAPSNPMLNRAITIWNPIAAMPHLDHCMIGPPTGLVLGSATLGLVRPRPCHGHLRF